MKKIKVIVVGAGNMASKVHYPSLNAINNVEICGILDINEERLDYIKNLFGYNKKIIYKCDNLTHYQKIINKLNPDAVYVIGQPNIMFDLWVWVLKNKYNLYIEKPMGLSLHQAKILKYLAEKNDVITQVSHQRRTVPLLLKLKKDLEKKSRIIHGCVEFFKFEPEPMLMARDHMFDDFTHSVDTARWICGGNVLKISSYCKSIETPDINWITCNLHFDNGSNCIITNSWVSGRRVFRVQMHSIGGYTDAEVEGDGYLYLDNDYKGIKLNTKVIAGSDELYIYGGFLNKHKEFINAITLNDKFIVSSPFSDTFKTIEICEKILASSILS